MISLKPNNLSTPDCISCSSKKVKENKIFFQGIHVLQDCTCESCGLEFYQTLPIAHDFYFPVKFSKDRKIHHYDKKVKDWHAEPLINSLSGGLKKDIEIEIKAFAEKKEIILLNCLDNVFAHFLSRLFNAQSLLDRHPDLGLVVLLPAKFEYLIPEGVSEIWTLKISIKECGEYIPQLDSFVEKQLERFEKVLLSKALYLNPYRFLDLGKILKTKPFDINKFHKTTPVVTFILREDRFWHNSKLIGFLSKVSVKFRLEIWLNPIFVRRQNQLVNRTVEKVANDFKNITFYATGMSQKGGLIEKIKDFRKNESTPEDEIHWLNLYAKSHLVVGVHGANMIFATSMAGGYIDIVPRHKISNWVEDTVLPYNSDLFDFLGRCLDEYSSPHLLYLHIKNILQDFEYRYLNSIQEPE